MFTVASRSMLRATATATSSQARRWFAAAAVVGDQLPKNVELHMGFPPKKHNLAEYAADKKLLLVGLPGAFTPTCSTKQIPNYLEHQDAIRKLGIDAIIVWAVNDSAVMQAWAKDQRTGLSMLKLMGDPAGDLTKALGVEMTHPGPASKGIIGRCKRHAIYAENGKIKVFHISEGKDDPAGDNDPSQTLAPAMINAIQALEK